MIGHGLDYSDEKWAWKIQMLISELESCLTEAGVSLNLFESELSAFAGLDIPETPEWEIRSRDISTQVLEQVERLFEPRRTVGQLFGRRFIARRSTVCGGSDEGVDQLQAVVAAGRGRLAGEAGVVHGAIEKIAGAVAGKHSAGAIGPVGSRRQADNQQAGIVAGAEVGHGFTVIGPVAEGGPLLPGDAAAVFAQAGTFLAGNDPPIQLRHGD